jgi:hypothetical protein
VVVGASVVSAELPPVGVVGSLPDWVMEPPPEQAAEDEEEQPEGHHRERRDPDRTGEGAEPVPALLRRRHPGGEPSVPRQHRLEHLAPQERGVRLRILGAEGAVLGDRRRDVGRATLELRLDHAEEGAIEGTPRLVVLGPLAQRLREREAALGERADRLGRSEPLGRRALERSEPGVGLVHEPQRPAVTKEVREGLAEGERAGRAIGLVGARREVRERAELGMLGRIDLRLRDQRCVQRLVERRARVPRGACDRGVQRRAEQIDVRPRIDLPRVAVHHLGRHERRGAHDADARALLLVELRGPQRDAPVDEVHLTVLPDHHVVRLHVAVDDAARVREVQRVGDAHEDLDDRADAIPVAALERGPRAVDRVAH